MESKSTSNKECQWLLEMKISVIWWCVLFRLNDIQMQLILGKKFPSTHILKADFFIVEMITTILSLP